MISPTALLLMVPAIILGTAGSFFLKKGAKGFTFNIKKWKDNITVSIGLFLFVLSTVFYLIALRFGELSVLYPLCSFTYVGVAIVSQRMLKEKMDRLKWLGIALIILGSFVVVW